MNDLSGAERIIEQLEARGYELSTAGDRLIVVPDDLPDEEIRRLLERREEVFAAVCARKSDWRSAFGLRRILEDFYDTVVDPMAGAERKEAQRLVWKFDHELMLAACQGQTQARAFWEANFGNLRTAIRTAGQHATESAHPSGL